MNTNSQPAGAEKRSSMSRGDNWPGSLVVYDAKVELAAVLRTAPDAGRRGYVLSPWSGERNAELGVDFPESGYTGFGDLDPNSSDVVADAEAKMATLLPDAADAKVEDTFFKQAVSGWVADRIRKLMSEGSPLTLESIVEHVERQGANDEL